MEKKNKIIIAAIIIALVILCGGLTYAYFTSAVNSESGSTIIAKGGTMNVIYDNGSGDIVVENIYPREKEWVTKKFTVTGNNTTDLNMYYRISMAIDNNEFIYDDGIILSYTLTSENTSNNGEVIPSVTSHKSIINSEYTKAIYGNENQVIGQGMFAKGQNQVHTYTLKIFFDDSGSARDNVFQGKSFAAHLVIDSVNENGDIMSTGDENIFAYTVTRKEQVNTFKVISNINAEQEYKINLNVLGLMGNKINYTLTSINEGNDGTTATEITNGEIKEDDRGTKISLGVGKLSSKKSVHSYTLTFSSAETENFILAAKVEVKKNLPELKTLILGTNNQNVLQDKATLTTSFDESGDKAGLYSSTDTNSGKPTYFFRGNVENNNVKFAGLNWKIIRINEDGSIRLIMNDGVYDNKKLKMCSNSDCPMAGFSGQKSYKDPNNNYAYTAVHSWYNSLLSQYQNDYLSTTNFCEEYKVRVVAVEDVAAIYYSDYISNYKCSEDTNRNYNDYVGTISIDELIHAGGYYSKESNIFLNGTPTWTLSQSSQYRHIFRIWGYSDVIVSNLYWESGDNRVSQSVRPVISLKSDVMASGNGTASNPYVIN